MPKDRGAIQGNRLLVQGMILKERLVKVILSCSTEIPTLSACLSRVYFQQYKSGSKDATKQADEVARNGALSRITSARGFLERPLLLCSTPSSGLLKIRHLAPDDRVVMQPNFGARNLNKQERNDPR